MALTLFNPRLVAGFTQQQKTPCRDARREHTQDNLGNATSGGNFFPRMTEILFGDFKQGIERDFKRRRNAGDEAHSRLAHAVADVCDRLLCDSRDLRKAVSGPSDRVQVSVDVRAQRGLRLL